MNKFSLIALTALVAPASAFQFTPVSQDRSVRATASGNDVSGTPVTDSDLVQAPDFAPFSETASASASGSLGSASGSAGQTSSIGSHLVSASGGCGASSSAPQLEPGAGAHGTSDSEFELVFDVTADSTYTAAGVVSSTGGGACAQIQLTESTETIFNTIAQGSPSLVQVDETGSLAPGRYTLRIGCEGFSFSSKFYTLADFSSFDVTFRVDELPGISYCSSLPNATGAPAVITATGDRNSGLVLTSSPVPDTLGQFFFGPTMLAGASSLGDGLRCVGGTTTRLLPFITAGMMMQLPNAASLTINYSAPYASGLMGTQNFQHWFRSGTATGTGSNTSDAISIAF